MAGRLIIALGAVLCGAGGVLLIVAFAFHQDVEGDPGRFKSLSEIHEWHQSAEYWSAIRRRVAPWFALGMALAGAGAALVYWGQSANA